MLPHPSVCFSFIAENTYPVLFPTVMLITQQQCVLAQQILLVSFVCGSGFILYYVVFGTSPYWFDISWLISSVFISFSCLASAWSSFLCFFAPLSSAPARRSAPNHVCTTPCRFDQIHAAISCHLRTKRDRRLLLYLSHISGGRISIQFILT